MRIILSPAKKMNVDVDSFDCRGLPVFLPKTEILLERLRGMTYEELKSLWRCSDGLAKPNYERLQGMELRSRLTPALLAYEGIQYRYMAPGVFTEEEFSYVQERLRILSGFYGLLRPFDGVVPYRLEMQARLQVGEYGDLYAFWGDMPARQLFSETDTVVNLASREYSRCISPYIPKGTRFLTCIFGEEKEGRVVEKATQCKMARGEMVRYMAEKRIEEIRELRNFDRLGYWFSAELSDESRYVFLRRMEQQPEY